MFIGRFGDVERRSNTFTKPAGCEPTDTVISLIPDNEAKEANVIYFPTCTRIKKCSGCCTSQLLSCLPTQTNTKTFEVTKSRFIGNGRMEYVGTTPVIEEEHLACKCQCTVQEKHCNAFQIYNKSQCRCECQNTDDRNKCIQVSRKIINKV